LKNLKLFLLVLLIFNICILIHIPVYAIDNPAFSVVINGMLDPETSFDGQGTMVVDWQITANKDGLTLRNTQGLRLAYDSTALQLIKWDGSGVVADASIGATFSPMPQAGRAGVYNFGFRVYAAKSTSGNIGYLGITLGDDYETYACSKGDLVSLAQVRFAFRPGKSDSDLTSVSIRCMDAGELAATNQSTAILINTDENAGKSYEYLRQAHGAVLGADTLNAPTITYPHKVSENGENGGNDGNKGLPNEKPGGSGEPDTPAGAGEPDISAGSAYANPYTDVTATAWYYSAIKYVTENNLMYGVGNNEFAPGIPMSRAMFATVLFRLAGSPDVTWQNTFTDVVDGQWYSGAICWGNENKLLMGYGNGIFGTNDNITREQAVAIIYLYSGAIGLDVSNQADLSKYDDAAGISGWALSAMRWGVSADIVTGRTTSELFPQGRITRAEVAQMLLNYSWGERCPQP
jgi:hypothetical protein